ncbi:uncharacterized protein LOC132760384 [Ruditapes philippinarum]|uniref:uncharacterized protein LOC132760384 n=1 Tax=Ruditapes philippinarum TaxID=129788 RepID=UPI00295AA6D7|nr:uncharacterized protein LOC132760384 [Ruditapes philippinarum]
MVDLFKLLSEAGIAEKDVESISTGRPGDYGYVLTFFEAGNVNLLRGKSLYYNGNPVHLVALGKQIVKLRLHWMPIYINDAVIHEFLGSYGKIIDIKRLSFFNKGVKIVNGIREVTLEVTEVERQSIPHLLKFEDGLAILITIFGRPPLCLRCSQVGHLQRNCIHGSFANVTKRNFQEKSTPANPDVTDIGEKGETTPKDVTNNEKVRNEDEEDGSKTDISANFDSDSDMENDDEDDEQEDDMDLETRGEKREIATGEDSFRKVFPPQKRRGSWGSRESSPKSGRVPPVTTSNSFSVLDGLTPIDTPDNIVQNVA